jgi:hypothetical protein
VTTALACGVLPAGLWTKQRTMDHEQTVTQVAFGDVYVCSSSDVLDGEQDQVEVV